jgi:hypothetical protein
MPNIDDQLEKKKLFKKKNYRSYISLEESLETAVSDLKEKVTQPVQKNLDPTSHETDNKVETNRQQTSNETDNKVETNRQQSGNNYIANVRPLSKTDNKPSTQPATQVATNRQQSGNKPATNSSFSTLVGLQRNIIILFYKQCKTLRSRETGPINLHFIASIVKTTENSAKVTIQRLEKKGLIQRVHSKNGRGGWACFELTDVMHQEMLQLETDNKLEANRQQTDNKPSTQPSTQPATSLPIVVVPNSLSLKTTNTESPISEQPCFIIPNELSGMVSRRQLTQFVLDGKISESELQMSLDAFAYDLRNKLVSTKHTANPVGLLIGAIKNNGGYNSQKFAEALKSEMKTALSSQQTLKDSISEAKSTEGWAKYQEMKTSSPEAFQALVSKYEKQGLKGELLEEFGFLDFQEQNRPHETEKNNPLRPSDV